MGGHTGFYSLKEADISTESKTKSTPALLEFGLRLSLAIYRNIGVGGWGWGGLIM